MNFLLLFSLFLDFHDLEPFLLEYLLETKILSVNQEKVDQDLLELRNLSVVLENFDLSNFMQILSEFQSI